MATDNKLLRRILQEGEQVKHFTYAQTKTFIQLAFTQGHTEYEILVGVPATAMCSSWTNEVLVREPRKITVKEHNSDFERRLRPLNRLIYRREITVANAKERDLIFGLVDNPELCSFLLTLVNTTGPMETTIPFDPFQL